MLYYLLRQLGYASQYSERDIGKFKAVIRYGTNYLVNTKVILFLFLVGGYGEN